jgi:AcrR family transcriptional regulator
MNHPITQPWILIGYELFSKEGPAGLKVEVVARKVGKSKSSFYHHFADVEIFTETLLTYHLERSKAIADREKLCKKMIPDMLNLLIEVKQDLLFNRQLRVNRHIFAYKKCFESANREVEDAFLEIWSETLGLSDNTNAARKVLEQSIENFYLQITDETLTYEWLLKFVGEIRFMVRAISHH